MTIEDETFLFVSSSTEFASTEFLQPSFCNRVSATESASTEFASTEFLQPSLFNQLNLVDFLLEIVEIFIGAFFA